MKELIYRKILATDSELSTKSNQKKAKEYFDENKINLEHEKSMLFSSRAENQ